jgi:hypothetical protein
MPAALEAACSAEYFVALLSQTLRRCSLIASRFDETFGSESIDVHTPAAS